MSSNLTITVGSGEPEGQLPPGNYPATLKSVTERTINVQGEDREVFDWTFYVETANDDGTPGDPIEVNGLSSRMTGPQSKTAQYLVALLGPTAVQPGATFTMNDLVGKPCLIQTSLNKGGYAKVDGASPMPTKATSRPTNRQTAVPAPPPPATAGENGTVSPLRASKPVAAPVAASEDVEVEEGDLPF